MANQLKALVSALLLGVAGSSANAALTVSFPTPSVAAAPGVSTVSTNSTMYQLTTGVGTGGAFVSGVTKIQGFGRITDFSGTPLANAGFCPSACELTYVFGDYTYSGKVSSTGNYLFTGGNTQLYVDFLSPTNTGATAISQSTLLSTNGVTAFNAARGGYANGFLLFNGTAHAAGPIALQPQTVSNSVSFTGSTLSAQLSACTAASGNITNVTITNALTQSGTFDCNVTTTPTFSGATLAVSSDLLSGKTLFDVISGQAFTNFNHNTQALSVLPSSTFADLSQTTTIGNSSNCFLNGSNITCLASVTTAAYVNPATVTLVPTPGSLALSGLGLLALGALRRRGPKVAV